MSIVSIIPERYNLIFRQIHDIPQVSDVEEEMDTKVAIPNCLRHFRITLVNRGTTSFIATAHFSAGTVVNNALKRLSQAKIEKLPYPIISCFSSGLFTSTRPIITAASTFAHVFDNC